MVRIYLLSAAVAAVPIAALGCPGNNCLRGIQRARTGTAACSSYMITTVTPSTETVTETVIVGGLPDFASNACAARGTFDVADRFSSACSCLGITAAILTAATPTTTVTRTVNIAAKAATAAATADSSAFILQVNSPRLADYYVAVVGGVLGLTTDIAAAAPFTVDDAGQLHSFHDPAKVLVRHPFPNHDNGVAQVVYNDVPSDTAPAITCTLVGRNVGDVYGKCSAPAFNYGSAYGFYTCFNDFSRLFLSYNHSGEDVPCPQGIQFFKTLILQPYGER